MSYPPSSRKHLADAFRLRGLMIGPCSTGPFILNWAMKDWDSDLYKANPTSYEKAQMIVKSGPNMPAPNQSLKIGPWQPTYGIAGESASLMPMSQ